MTDYHVQAVLSGGTTISAESLDDAVEKAIKEDYRGKTVTSITVEDRETGEERHIQLA